MRIACADVGSRRSLATRLAVLGAAVVIPIAGCTPKTGSAAVVQSTRISVSSFRNVVTAGITPEIAANPADQEAYQRNMLGLLINQYVLPQVAAAVGVTVNDAQAQTLVSQANQRQPGYLKSIGIPPQYELAWGKQALEFQRLNEMIARDRANEARIADVSKGIPVSVNPRFGSWNSARLQVDPARTDLSSPPKGAPPPSPAIPIGG